MTSITADFISSIFYSGQFAFTGDKEVTNKISFLINEGYLLFTTVIIALKMNI